MIRQPSSFRLYFDLATTAAFLFCLIISAVAQNMPFLVMFGFMAMFSQRELHRDMDKAEGR